jgi:hypothetical protein
MRRYRAKTFRVIVDSPKILSMLQQHLCVSDGRFLLTQASCMRSRNQWAVRCQFTPVSAAAAAFEQAVGVCVYERRGFRELLEALWDAHIGFATVGRAVKARRTPRPDGGGRR